MEHADGSEAGRLDRLSPVPLYHQLERALLELIVGSGMAPDARFPSESELSERFGVTRPTVRQALERLVRVGVLRKERGRGTYVATVPDRPLEPEPADPPTVKVIMPSLTDLIHLRVLAGIVDEAHRRQVQVLLAHSDNRRPAQDRELAGAAACAGVVLWPIKDGGGLPATGPPVVFLDRYLDAEHDHVVVDDIGGAGAVTDHLAGCGHRRIAFVHAEPRSLSSVGRRLDGYREGLQRNGLDFDRPLVARVGLKGGASVDRMLDTFFALPDPPTAAFCVNDMVAVQVFTALRDRGIEVPAQFSVAGFDALEVLPSAGTLTSVSRATEQMGRRAVQLLVDRIREPDAPPRHVELPTSLVIGDTTGPLARVARSRG
ncbi:MAG TPA: GntR family transcriptional regulator [Mycobacteriales bacterium]|nr:GntR family transcriptional regulator [Mycobacteriales bacterium]